VEIGHRAAKHLIEEVVRRLDGGGVVRYGASIAMDRAQGTQDGNGSRRLRGATADGDEDAVVAVSSLGGGSKFNSVCRKFASSPR
jgi:hypothetical protein